MKLGTQQKTRTDVMQYCIDGQFAIKTIELPSALTADLKAGDCIDPATGASGIQIISATLMDEWREVANC